MLRRLLTCLALLTGLAAASPPVQAEVAAAMASRVEASASGQPVAHRSAVAVVALLPSVPETIARRSVSRLIDRAVHVPAVLVGIDRSRE